MIGEDGRITYCLRLQVEESEALFVEGIGVDSLDS